MSAPDATLFVFEAVGTRGDIAPLLAIAQELVSRGHACQLIGPEAFAPEARAAGVGFRASTTRTQVFSSAEAAEFENYYFPCLERVGEHFAELARLGAPLVVVNIDKTCASNLLAEKYELPVVRLHLSPFKIRSLVSPPSPFRERAQGAFGRAFLKHTLPQLLDKADRDPRLLAHVNNKRLGLGLPPCASLAHSTVQKELGLFPSWFCAPASDWPEGLELVGFPLSSPRAELGAGLRQFLAREAAPIVFTTGTGVADVAAFFEHARICCAELDRPGVFLSPHLDTPLGPRTLQVDFAELGLLLPQAALFVHHGGIGGTARALEAGVAQIVSPIGYDQPDNAHRVAELGVGQVVERSSLSGSSLARVARELLESPACAARVSAQKNALQVESGVRLCAERLAALSPVARKASLASAAVSGSRSVVFVVWPEQGHVASPLVLARQLRERGDRVVFAGLDLIGDVVQRAGFEFFELARLSPSQAGVPSSVLWRWSAEESLADAVAALSARFAELTRSVQPSLVLFDSLYSLLGIMAQAHGLPWAMYETDLPRELDPAVPAPGSHVLPTPANREALRSEWAKLLKGVARSRSLASGAEGGWGMASRYPDALMSELSRQLGVKALRLRRATTAAPVAFAERLIFCPKAFDFERSRTEGVSWVDPCVGGELPGEDFPWASVAEDRPLVYCSLGTQAVRTPRALVVLQSVLDALAELPGLFLVMACSRFKPGLGAPLPNNVLLVPWAPQRQLIRRASVVITHGGFNSIKECVSEGVPMVVAPLSHDQPRNAALIQHRGLGLSLGPESPRPESVRAAILEVMANTEVRQNVQRFAREFRAERDRRSALEAVDRLIARGPQSMSNRVC